MKKYYTAGEALRVLALNTTPASYQMLRRMAKAKKIRAIRKNNGPRAYRYFNSTDIQKLAFKLERKPRNTLLVGEAARRLHITTMTVLRLRKRGLLHAVRDPISRYWLFDVNSVENYRKKLLQSKKGGDK